MEILVDEKNAEIVRLYEQLKAKDEQLAKKDEQLRVKDVQIAEKRQAIGPTTTIDFTSNERPRYLET